MTVIHLDGHPREEDLAAYVADELALAPAEQLEAHVLDCPVCASRLQRAASWQMVLHEAAAALVVPAMAVPPRRSWLRRHAGAMSGLWAAAAAMALVILQPGGSVALDAEPETPTVAAVSEGPWIEPPSSRCAPTDPRCADGLLASVDPLQSVDPLSTWPDEFTSASWDGEPEGEPCGSGEDGGPLVCQPSSG